MRFIKNRIFYLAFIFILLNQYSFAQNDYVMSVQAQRDQINLEFADTSKGILLPEDLLTFKGLHFFPVDEAYRVKAKYKKLLFKKQFEMATSTERKPIYRKYAKLKFELNSVKCKLFLYENLSYKEAHPEYRGLFCPFKDSTSGKESYGAGRYLDFDLDSLAKEVFIDFNLSYNPYCAYNYNYSCPITPSENTLNTRVLAGVKTWH